MENQNSKSTSTRGKRSPRFGRSTKGRWLPTRDSKRLKSIETPTVPRSHPPLPDLQEFKEIKTSQIPEIRQDRLDRIRAALKRGEYNIPSDLIAGRIIQDIILNESLPED